MMLMMMGIITTMIMLISIQGGEFLQLGHIIIIDALVIMDSNELELS